MISTRASATLCLLLAAVCACSSGASHATAAASGGGSNDGAALEAPTGTAACTIEPGAYIYAAGLKMAGSSGLFNFELVASDPAPPAINDNTFVVRVTDADGAALDGQLGATLFMPVHQHYSPESPVVTFDATSGTFTLDPMDLFMVGLWRITFTFQPQTSGADAAAAGASDASDASDSAAFEFCLN